MSHSAVSVEGRAMFPPGIDQSPLRPRSAPPLSARGGFDTASSVGGRTIRIQPGLGTTTSCAVGAEQSPAGPLPPPHAWEAGTEAEREWRKSEKGAHRRAMKLSAMYQRIPNSILQRASKRTPASWAVQRLPRPGEHSPPIVWQPPVSAYGRDSAWLNKRKAIWVSRSFPPSADLEEALLRIEESNAAEAGVLKYQITFTDGAHIRFARSDADQPGSLSCIEFYSLPHGHAPPSPKRQSFLVNGRGHLLRRKKHDRNSFGGTVAGNILHWSRRVNEGHAGFAFTPMGYMGHAVRPNSRIRGVRPGLCETSARAFEFRARTPTSRSRRDMVLPSRRGQRF
eukprot:Hpha_TRINITY_DN15922_c3_g2::TRINITY_DN15922_c3_g2_i1::g.71633::m.71633